MMNIIINHLLLYAFIQAAIRNSLHGLNDRNLFLTVLRGWEAWDQGVNIVRFLVRFANDYLLVSSQGLTEQRKEASPLLLRPLSPS